MIDWLSAVFSAAGDVMTLGTPHVPTLGIAVGIAFFAGASTLIGHSAVLYINRITGWRALASLVLSGVLLVLLYVVNALVLALLAPLITGTILHPSYVAAIALASTAPMILGLFEFAPAIGLIFGRVLSVWSFLALWALIAVGYETTWLRALLTGGAGWLVVDLLASLLGPTIGRITGRIWRAVTGVPTQITARDLLSGTPVIPLSAETASGERTQP